jgi:hypothetical protein
MTTSPTSQFELLAEAMPKIAELVNAFSSEQVQRNAFEALVAALGSPVSAPETTPKETPSDAGLTSSSGSSGDASPNGTKKSARKRAQKRNFTVPRGLNFSPSGKQSLEDFVAEKQPRTQFETNLVAVYYLSEVMGEQAIDVGKVLAVYQAMPSWTAPTQPDTVLRNTASSKGWLDTSNMKDIKVVWAGTNHLDKMPSGSKKPS